jgi:hypothetical protein
MVRILLASSLALLLALPFAPAADVKLDNPTYASWSKVDVGTAVVFTETKTFFDGKSLTYTHTYTLKELTADGARVEHVVVTQLDGREIQAEKVEYPEPRQKKLPEGSTAEDALKPLPGARAGGQEKLKVGAKEYATRKFTTVEKLPGGYDLTTTYWYADDVPGRLVKKVAEKTTTNFRETSTQVLVEVKRP